MATVNAPSPVGDASQRFVSGSCKLNHEGHSRLLSVSALCDHSANGTVLSKGDMVCESVCAHVCMCDMAQN